MTALNVEQHVTEATSTFDLARRLGRQCIEHEVQIGLMRLGLKSATDLLLEQFEHTVIATGPGDWHPRSAGPGCLTHLLDQPALRSYLPLLQALPELSCLHFLRDV